MCHLKTLTSQLIVKIKMIKYWVEEIKEPYTLIL